MRGERAGRAVEAMRGEHGRAFDALRGEHHDFVHAPCRDAVAAQDERERAFEERLAEINAAKEALGAQFAEVGGQG